MKSFPYVGCFSGHMKKIVSLFMHPTENILISASEDSTVRFWRMETFQETYRYDVLEALFHAFLANSKTLCYTSKNSIHVLDLHSFHFLFTLVGSRIVKTYLSQSEGRASRIMVLAEDEGIRLISPVHGLIVTMMFPVVTHKPIAYAHDLSEEKVYVLLEDGGVMVKCTTTNPCR